MRKTVSGALSVLKMFKTALHGEKVVHIYWHTSAFSLRLRLSHAMHAITSKSMGKKSTLLYLLWRKRFWVESYRIGQLWTIRVKNCITYPSKGQLRSPEVTNRHLPITFDQKEIETWDWCQYVRLGQANRLICNMTHFGHHVTLAWLDLRSNFDLDLSKSFYKWFEAP